MIRKRFLPLRGLKIVTWTIAGVAWVTAAIAGRAAATTTAPSTTSTTETTTQAAQSQQQQSGVPGLPQDGLIIIRAGSTNGSQQAQATQQVQQPQKQVVRRVVTQAPVRQRSGGS